MDSASGRITRRGYSKRIGRTCSDGGTSMIYQQSIFGEERELTAQPSSPVDSRVNLSAWPVNSEGSTTSGIFGHKCSELSESLGRVGWLVKTYLEYCELPRTKYVRVWSARVTKSGYWIMKLRLSERRTGESGSRLLPTPVATIGTHGGPNQRDSGGRMGLQMAARVWVSTPTANPKPRSHRFAAGRTPNPAEAAKMWPTPNTMDHLPARSLESLQRMATGARKGRKELSNLREAIDPDTNAAWSRLWPTPTTPNGGWSVAHVTDWRSDRTAYYHGKKVQVDLNAAVRMWPTPTATDANDRLTDHPRKDATATRSITLAQKMRMLPTPKAQNARGNGERHGDGGPSLDVVAGGQLNPTWVEWLMGYPLGWTDLNA